MLKMSDFGYTAVVVESMCKEELLWDLNMIFATTQF